MAEIEKQYPHLAALADSYRLPPQGRAAVRESYDAFRRFHGPFITSIAGQMLPDLRVDAERGRTIVFLGRDGHSFAAATRALAPEFFARHCREVVLSRVVAETAIQDLERHRGSSFPEIEAFRGTRGRVAPESVPGAYRQLTAYLRNAGVPVGREGSRVTVVDSSFKGTVQEMLTAAYERTDFQGRYAFFGAAPGDPRPERKHGYVVHLQAEQTGEGKGFPFEDLHPDAAWTFASKEPINAIEDALNGPMDTPLGMTAGGPVQRPQREDPEAVRGFNPLLMPQRFRDPVTREAVKAAGLLAVHDAAAERAGGQSSPDWLNLRLQERAEFTDSIRQWASRSDRVDPLLKTVLDSVVRRADHPVYTQLQDSFTEKGISERQARHVWRHMEELPQRDVRAAFARSMIAPQHREEFEAARLASLGYPGSASRATARPPQQGNTPPAPGPQTDRPQGQER
ncbi:ABC transporter permease [Streptomyces sp. NBC_00134]|uniref:ABC transporter permease n=1 Tax=Streptomyces sp. NBC_00134 TaxID=2975663 RepID=UPI002F91A1A7